MSIPSDPVCLWRNANPGSARQAVPRSIRKVGNRNFSIIRKFQTSGVNLCKTSQLGPKDIPGRLANFAVNGGRFPLYLLLEWADSV